MEDKLDIQTNIIISGILLKNDYGTNQLFQVLDNMQLGYIFELAEENLKMLVWRYNEKCYLEVNDQKLLIMQLVNLKLMVALI